MQTRNAKNTRVKRIKVPTPDYLANVALYYLSRYAASEASLRRVLENRIRRANMAHPDFAADHSTHENLRKTIDKIVEQHKKSGAINDEAFASMKVSSLRRSGRSTRIINQKLLTKGIKQNIIETALAQEDQTTSQDADLKAALIFAKRKGLGPFRRPSVNQVRHSHDEENQISVESIRNRDRKEAAALARAGFTFDIIRKILGNQIEDLEN